MTVFRRLVPACALLAPTTAFVVPTAARATAASFLRGGGERGLSMMADAESEVKDFLTKALGGMGESAISGDGDKIQAWLDEYCGDGGFFIRPSGNPLGFNELKDMWTSPDVEVTKSDMVSIDSVKVFAGGNAAVCTYTMYDIFNYKGTPNEDYAKNTAVLEKTDGKWKWIQGHRATGQPPP